MTHIRMKKKSVRSVRQKSCGTAGMWNPVLGRGWGFLSARVPSRGLHAKLEQLQLFLQVSTATDSCPHSKCVKQQKRANEKKREQKRLVYVWETSRPQNDTNPPSAFGQVRDKRRLPELSCVTEWAPATLVFFYIRPRLCILRPLTHTHSGICAHTHCLHMHVCDAADTCREQTPGAE